MPSTLIEGMIYILELRVILKASVIIFYAIEIFIVEPILGYIIQQFGSSQQQEIERSTGYINEYETRLEKEILFEKRMDSVLERGILASFPEDECLQRIVRKEFLKSNQCEDKPKVDILAIKAIKSIMHKKMMTDEMDLYSKSIYKLIFKETLSDWNDLFEKKTSNQPLENSTGVDNRTAQLDRLRSDGPIMFSILSQTIPRLFHGCVKILVHQNSVTVSSNKYNSNRDLIDENCFLDIPHRDGFEYDTYWAEKFTKLAMSRYSKDVCVAMCGADLPSDQVNNKYMYNFLNKSIVDKLPRVIPSEGWRQYISKEQPVYQKLSQGVYITIRFFHFCRKVVHSESDSSSYWGYLRDDY